MATLKISQLTAAAAATGTQELEVNESGTSKKITGAQLATYIEGEVSSSPTFTGQSSFPDGTAGAPSITNTGDTNTGIFHPAEDTVAISTGGTERIRVNSSGHFVTTGNIELGHATDTTISRSAAGVIAVEGGVVPKENRANTFTANQIIEVSDNTNAALRVTQLGTGDALRIEDSTNPDSTPVVVDASGNVGIGTATPAGPLHVDRSTSGANAVFTSSANFNRIVLQNTSGTTVQAFVQSDGFVQSAIFGTLTNHPVAFFANAAEQLRIAATGTLTSQPTYDNTGTGSTVVVSSAGLIRRTSSSIKYKKDVEALDQALTDHAIANLRPIWYRSKNAEGDDKAEWSHIGLIAEEVDQVEKRLVRYRTVEVTTDENGNRVETPLAVPEPEDVDYARLSVLLLDKVQRLEARIAQLEAR